MNLVSQRFTGATFQVAYFTPLPMIYIKKYLSSYVDFVPWLVECSNGRPSDCVVGDNTVTPLHNIIPPC